MGEPGTPIFSISNPTYLARGVELHIFLLWGPNLMSSATQTEATLILEHADQRRLAVQSAIGSLRIEGMEPDKAELEIVELFARGEIDFATMSAQMDAYSDAGL